jgi:hypothetical protein
VEDRRVGILPRPEAVIGGCLLRDLMVVVMAGRQVVAMVMSRLR